MYARNIKVDLGGKFSNVTVVKKVYLNLGLGNGRGVGFDDADRCFARLADGVPLRIDKIFPAFDDLVILGVAQNEPKARCAARVEVAVVVPLVDLHGDRPSCPGLGISAPEQGGGKEPFETSLVMIAIKPTCLVWG